MNQVTVMGVRLSNGNRQWVIENCPSAREFKEAFIRSSYMAVTDPVEQSMCLLHFDPGHCITLWVTEDMLIPVPPVDYR